MGMRSSEAIAGLQRTEEELATLEAGRDLRDHAAQCGGAGDTRGVVELTPRAGENRAVPAGGDRHQTDDGRGRWYLRQRVDDQRHGCERGEEVAGPAPREPLLQ